MTCDECGSDVFKNEDTGVFLCEKGHRHAYRQVSPESYGECQKRFDDGIKKDFSPEDLESIKARYTPEELKYSLCNSPVTETIPFVLLYQIFHAGIVELGISKRYADFKKALQYPVGTQSK